MAAITEDNVPTTEEANNKDDDDNNNNNNSDNVEQETTTTTAETNNIEKKDTTATNEAEDDANAHKLQESYTFWYMKRGQKNSAESYEDSIKQISTFSTIKKFWKIYSHIMRPGDPGSEKPMDYILFKKGIKPMWEDEQNKRGGKWVVRIPKKLSAYYWESILLAILGEQFDVGDEICGCVLSVRFSEDVISIWNRDCSNKQVLTRIRDIMRRTLKLPGQVQMDYRRHDTALADVGVDGGATVNNSNNNNSSGWSTAGNQQNNNHNNSRNVGGYRRNMGGNSPTRGDRRGGAPRMNRGSSAPSSGAPSGRWR